MLRKGGEGAWLGLLLFLLGWRSWFEPPMNVKEANSRVIFEGKSTGRVEEKAEEED